MGALCCAQNVGPKEKFDLLDEKRVNRLIEHVKNDVLKTELKSPEFAQKCKDTFAELDANKNNVLDNEELAEAVKKVVAEQFRDRIKVEDIADLARAFDANKDGKIQLDEFVLFSQWAQVMYAQGFFGGASPFSVLKKADVYNHLLLVSEGLDPEKKLNGMVPENVQLGYYHPDSITSDEMVGQLDALASRFKRTFKSVALLIPGPDEKGKWAICADKPLEPPPKEADAQHEYLKSLAEPLSRLVKSGGRLAFFFPKWGASEEGKKQLTMVEEEFEIECCMEVDDDGTVAFVGGRKEEKIQHIYILPGNQHEVSFKSLRDAYAKPIAAAA